MNALRAVIVDDERAARDALRSLLDREPDLDVVEECDNGARAVDAVRRLAPDVLFLDIEMPDLDGFQVLEQLQAIPAVVFVTAFDRYAIDAFRVDAVDYLLKPFDAERLRETLARVRKRQSSGDASAEQWLATLRRLADHDRPLERVAVLDGDATVVLRTAEIRWMESDGNYMRLHTGERAYLARSTLRFMEQRLDPNVSSGSTARRSSMSTTSSNCGRSATATWS